MENDTCPQLYNLIPSEGMTRFSNNQIAYYCPLYAEHMKFERKIYFYLGLSGAITGAVGLIGNVLTFLTFAKGPDFAGPSFVYHKSMALLELVHMAVMLQCGVLQLLGFPGDPYWMTWWRERAWVGWMIGDLAKLAADCLVMFVSLERMVAICLPLKFDLINTNGVAIGAIVISILMGSLQLSGFGAMTIVREGRTYVEQKTAFWHLVFKPIILNIINVVKFALGVITGVCCVMIIVGIYRLKKCGARLSQDSWLQRRAFKMACYLQLVLAITTVVTHATFVWFKVVELTLCDTEVGLAAILQPSKTFAELLSDLSNARYLLYAQLVHAIFSELDHGGRFFFYLIFHSRFRATFKGMWTRGSKTKVTPMK